MNKEERKFYADLTDTKSWDKVLGSLSTLKEENRILKENTEHNDKVVDKVIWDNRLLKQALIDIKEYVKSQEYDYDDGEYRGKDCCCDGYHILPIIDKVLGGNNE